jgi:hypothetical protein
MFNIEEARAFLSKEGIDVDAIAPQVEGKFMSAFMRATKPGRCCGPVVATNRSHLMESSTVEAMVLLAACERAGDWLDASSKLAVRVGFELSHLHNATEVIDSTNRQKRENQYFRRFEVHGGYIASAHRVAGWIRSGI